MKFKSLKFKNNKIKYTAVALASFFVTLVIMVLFTEVKETGQAIYGFTGTVTDSGEKPVYGAYVFPYIDENPEDNPEILERSAECIKNLSKMSGINDGKFYGITDHSGNFKVSVGKKYEIKTPWGFHKFVSKKPPYKTIYIAVFKHGRKVKYLTYKIKELKKSENYSDAYKNDLGRLMLSN